MPLPPDAEPNTTIIHASVMGASASGRDAAVLANSPQVPVSWPQTRHLPARSAPAAHTHREPGPPRWAVARPDASADRGSRRCRGNPMSPTDAAPLERVCPPASAGVAGRRKRLSSAAPERGPSPARRGLVPATTDRPRCVPGCGAWSSGDAKWHGNHTARSDRGSSADASAVAGGRGSHHEPGARSRENWSPQNDHRVDLLTINADSFTEQADPRLLSR